MREQKGTNLCVILGVIFVLLMLAEYKRTIHIIFTIFVIVLFNAHRSYDVKCLVTALVTKRLSCCMTVKKSFKTAEKIQESLAKVEDFSGAYSRIYRSLRLPLDVGGLMVMPQKRMKGSYEDLLQ